MAGDVKGLTVELGGETTGLEAALKRLGKSANDINRELGQIERELKFNPTSTVLLGQKQELLAAKISATRDRLDALQQAQARVDAMFAAGEIDDGQYRRFQRDLEGTRSKLGTFEGQLRDVETAQRDAAAGANRLGDELDRAGEEARAAGAAAVTGAGGFKLSFANIAAAAAAAAAGAGAALIGLAQSVLDNADKLQIMSDATGLSAERLQELQYIGADVGVELDTIAGAQAKLTKSMNAARDGSGAQAEAFKKLGINVLDANGSLRDAKVVMGEAFDALSKMGNETERDAASMAIFGRGAQDLNPLIKLGADGIENLSQKARENGAVMSDEAVTGLDAFGDSLDQLKQGAMAQFGEWFNDILPTMQPFLDTLQGGVGGDVSLIPPELQAQLDTLGATIDEFTVTRGPEISSWFDEFIGPTMDEITAAFESVAMEVIPTITAIVDFVSANWPEIQRAIEPVMTSVRNLISGAMLQISGVIRTVMAVIRGDWGAAWEGVQTAVRGVFLQLQSTPIGQWIQAIIDTVKRVGPQFEDMRKKVAAIIDGLLAQLRGPIDKIKALLSNLNPFQRHSPSLVDNVLAGVDVIRSAYASLDGMRIGGPVLAGVSAGYGPASPMSVATSNVSTISIGSITVDGTKMTTPDFNGLIASIQMAARMEG